LSSTADATLNNVNNDKNLSCKPRSFSKDWSCLKLSTQVFTLDLGCRFEALTRLLMCTKIYTNLTDETNFLQGPLSYKVKSLQITIDQQKNLVTQLHKWSFYRINSFFNFYLYIYIFSKQRLYFVTSQGSWIKCRGMEALTPSVQINSDVKATHATTTLVLNT